MDSWTYLHDHLLTGQGLEAKGFFPAHRSYRNDRQGEMETRPEAVFGTES